MRKWRKTAAGLIFCCWCYALLRPCEFVPSSGAQYDRESLLSNAPIRDRIKLGLEIEGNSRLDAAQTANELADLLRAAYGDTSYSSALRELSRRQIVCSDQTDGENPEISPDQLGVITDLSLSNTSSSGVSFTYRREIVTPALGIADTKRLLSTIMPALKKHMAVDRRAGLHVHVGLEVPSAAASSGSSRFPYAAWQVANLAKIVIAMEDTLDRLHPVARRNNRHCLGYRQSSHHFGPALSTPRGFKLINGIAGSPSGNEMDFVISDRIISMMTAKDQRPGTPSLQRRFAYNFTPLLNRWNIEFRQHAGTLEVDAMIDWLDVVVAIFEAAMTWAPERIDALSNPGMDIWMHTEFLKHIGVEKQAARMMIRAARE